VRRPELHRGRERQAVDQGKLRQLFKDACKAAGVPGSAHGVRKIAATRAANHGATVAQLEAIFGWRQHGLTLHPVGGSQAARD